MVWASALTLIGLATQGPPTLSLAQAERLAVEHAFAVRIAKSNVEKALQQRRQAEGGLGPRLDLAATYTRLDERATVFPGSETQDPILGPIDTKVTRLSLVFPIDLFGVLRKSVQAAELNRRATADLLADQVNAVKNLVRDAYYEILRADQVLEVQKEALASAEERLDKARKRLDAGAIAKFDVLRFETEVSRAQAAVIAATNRRKQAKNNLNSVLGRPIETAFETEPVVASAALLPAADRYVEAALRNRPDLRSAQNIVLAYERILKTAMGGNLPTLSLGATHTWTIDPGFGGRENQTVATAQLTFNVFDSGITRAKVASAREELEQARIRLEQLRLAASLEVRQALIRAENALQTLEVAERTVVQQREALRVAQLKFDVGEGILLDVTDAQVELTRAQEAVIAARFDYLSAYAALQRAVGVDELGSALSGAPTP
ncbi:MAG TPA: TolC family protein [Fimbriimonadaceae bacterium]|nr:TolC family protein [Fimbriimonadaceae bacterium]HRJ95213.1 TolC family protein [Fimbriimonadaceae bacterium]